MIIMSIRLSNFKSFFSLSPEKSLKLLSEKRRHMHEYDEEF